MGGWWAVDTIYLIAGGACVAGVKGLFCRIVYMFRKVKAVIPAKAGIQCHMLNSGWIPAFAGMTRRNPSLRRVANQYF